MTNYIKAERFFEVLGYIDFDKLNLQDIPSLIIHFFGKVSEIGSSTNYGYEVKTYFISNRDIIEINAYETPNEGYLIQIFSNHTNTPLFLYRFILVD